jgi:hypothetical protein
MPCFQVPQNGFLFLDQDIWRLQKTRQDPKNLAVFPKVNNRRRPKTL